MSRRSLIWTLALGPRGFPIVYTVASSNRCFFLGRGTDSSQIPSLISSCKAVNETNELRHYLISLLDGSLTTLFSLKIKMMFPPGFWHAFSLSVLSPS